MCRALQALPAPGGQSLAQHTGQHLLWYMEKDRNWFLNIWYMSPSGLWRDSAGWGMWGWEGTASPACPTAQAAPPWDKGHTLTTSA